MIKRRIAAVFLIIFLAISTMPAAAESGLSIQDKADVLNKLSILKGGSGGYNLNGQLLRSEAAAFVVRLLGVEEHVLANKEAYWITPFADVISTRWYAPYVGYCVEQDIINGEPDGYFHPNNAVSEKAFLKIILTALGYVYGEDFVWEDVYPKAYSVGIVKDIEYIYKNMDNIQYTRGAAVDALYNALTLENKDTGVTIIQNLVDAGAVSEDVALSTGLLDGDGWKEEEDEEEDEEDDDAEAKIKKIDVLSEYEISIEFNRDMEEIDEDSIVVYETYDISEQLDIEIESLEGNILVLKTSKQTERTDYTVEIEGAVDCEGNVIDFMEGSFKGFRPSTIKSDFFRISRAEAISMNVINLYFTQPVNINSEIPNYYTILEDGEDFVSGSARTLTVKAMSSNKNGVAIYLKNQSFADGMSYTLRVSGDLTSAYGVRLNEGEGDEIEFTGVDTEDKEFELVKTTLKDDRTVQLEFNKEVNPVLATQVYSYYLTDEDDEPIKINSAVVAGIGNKKGKVVLLGIEGRFRKDERYRLRINILSDAARLSYITEEDYTFTASFPSATYLDIRDVEVIDKATVKIRFNKQLDEVSALKTSYYIIEGVTHSRYSAYPAKIFYDAENSPDTVKLHLPKNATMVGGETYKLVVSRSLKDFSGQSPKEKLEYEIECGSDKIEMPCVSEALIISEEAIKLTFNREIALDIANIMPSNYSLQYRDSGATLTKIPTSVIFIDYTTMILKFDKLDFNTEYTLKFNTLKDYTGLYTSTDKDEISVVKVKIGE